jgi:hypothetical protein
VNCFQLSNVRSIPKQSEKASGSVTHISMLCVIVVRYSGMYATLVLHVLHSTIVYCSLHGRDMKSSDGIVTISYIDRDAENEKDK